MVQRCKSRQTCLPALPVLNGHGYVLLCSRKRHKHLAFMGLNTRKRAVSINVVYTGQMFTVSQWVSLILKEGTAANNFCFPPSVWPVLASLLVSQHRLSVANTQPSCTISVFNTESFPRSPCHVNVIRSLC